MNKKVITVVFMVIIFGLPIGWYFFLHAFGENQFALPELGEWDNECISSSVAFVAIDSTAARDQVNEFNRVQKKLNTVGEWLNVTTISAKSCDLDFDVYLVDEAGMVRGVFILEREEVDRFLAEVDIYVLNQKNGKADK